MGNETTDIEEALRSGAVRLVPVEPNDKMMVMGGFRFAGKVPNSLVFKEVRKGWDDMLSQAPDHTPALLALIEERDEARKQAQALQLDAVAELMRASASEAKCDALREALALYRDAVRIDVQMDGPKFMGSNASALKRAWEADRALSQETADV